MQPNPGANSRNTPMYDVVIEVSGKEHTGKTSVIAAIATQLESLGVTVILQRIDPQLDEKLAMTDKVKERLANTTVFIREMQTAF
jgi:molybdopterin-guanine dinucleotide biosynthesis protein